MRPDWASALDDLSTITRWHELKEGLAAFLEDVRVKAAEEDPFRQADLISSAYRIASLRTAGGVAQEGYAGIVRPADIALVWLGGEARREVSLRFDQDSAAILRTESAPYLDYLKDVVDRLAWMGVRRCQGGVMASEEGWHGSEQRWRRRLRFLLRGEVTREDVRASTILLDMDLLYGDEGLFGVLRDTLRDGFAKASTLQRYLAEDLLEIPPYTDIFGRLAREHRADRRGLFNFKFACQYPLTAYLRIEAWKNGITEAPSRVRIRRLHEAGRFSATEAEGLIELLRSIIGLRLTQQRRQLEVGAPTSDYFDLDLFTKQERRELLGAVRRVEALKKRMRWVYWLR